MERDGLRWISCKVVAANPNTLRALGSQIIGQLEDGVVILGAGNLQRQWRVPQ